MRISKDMVRHVAVLARLEFKEAELEKLTEQLGNILEHIEELSGLDTSNVDPTFHVLDISTPVREDVVMPWLSSDEALENAPRREDDFFSVPKVIED